MVEPLRSLCVFGRDSEPVGSTTMSVLLCCACVRTCTLTQIHALGGPVARHVASVVGNLVGRVERRRSLKIAAEVEQIPDDSLIPTLDFPGLRHRICCCCGGGEELLCFALCLFVCLAICHCRAPESQPPPCAEI